MPLPKENQSEVSIGGFQGIKRVKGVIVSIDLTSPPASWESDSDIVKVSMEDTVILEMFGDEEPFELKDGKFEFYIPYKLDDKGKISSRSIYNVCWLGSAKEIDPSKKPSDFIGRVSTLEKQARMLFPMYVDPRSIEGNMEQVFDDSGAPIEKNGKVRVNVLAKSKSGLPNHFCFVLDETVDSNSIKDYIKEKIVGLNDKAALRALLVDTRAKQFPEFKDKLKEGAEVLADYLGIEFVDGKFGNEASSS